MRTITDGCRRCEEWTAGMASEIEMLRYEAAEWQRQAQKDRGVIDADKRETCLPITVALVGCGKQKSKLECKANEMYTGTLFRLAYEHAERTADDIHILSALHGLLSPFQMIESYEHSINQMLLHEQYEWGQWVVSELFMLYPLTRLRIVFYAGQAYIRPILEAAAYQESYWEMRTPLKGLDLFERIRWFRDQRGDNDDHERPRKSQGVSTPAGRVRTP